MRCMFESNFPMDRETTSHRVLFNMYKRVCQAMNLSALEKKAIFHDVAVKTYRLDVHGHVMDENEAKL